jgi:hypothetical protein
MREKRLGSTVAALGALVVALFLPAVAGAQEGGLDSGDTAWMLTATALVLFMTLPGSHCSTLAWCVPRTCSPC